MSKSKVMDDLDALLADLQCTTTHIQNYQVQQEREREQASRESTPPPLPPHPLLDGSDNMYDTEQPLYEQTNVKPQFSTTTVVTRVNNQPTNGVNTRTSLTNNLSELDTLLQDLSSAQFIAEVDRRHSGIKGEEEVILQNTAPPRDKTVDSLLYDLETTLPPPRHEEPMQNHYESVNIQHSPALSNQINHGSRPAAASTATRELDDLMASLSEFKMSNPRPNHQPYPVQPNSQTPQHVGEPPYAQPNRIQAQQAQQGSMQASPGGNQANNLDAMLGNLNTDMTKQGVMIVPKGNCAACNNPIVGQVITALGRIWHPEHFTCQHCQDELGTRNFFERDGVPYCERDYHMLFSPRCAACNGPILDKCMTALDTTFHPECFRCAHCNRVFGDDGFHEKDGQAYCREDYFAMFAPKCGGCNRAIMDNYISALNKQWHTECFVCRECHKSFGASSFFDHDGFPYCETHYHARRGSLCAGCQKPITGRCITAMYKKFHPEHFVCAFCLKQLNKGTFKEQNDKPYCHPCFVKLFG